MPKQQEPPGDRREDCERVEELLAGGELAALVLASGLQRLEVLLDDPARPVAVHDVGDLFARLDGQGSEQKPLDRDLAQRRLWLQDVDDVDGERLRSKSSRGGRARQS